MRRRVALVFVAYDDACCEGTKSWPSPLMTPQNASSQGVDSDLLVDLPLFSSLFLSEQFQKRIWRTDPADSLENWDRSIWV